MLTTEDGSAETWVEELSRVVLDSEDAVGETVEKGDEPVDAIKTSTLLEVVVGSSEEVVESLETAAAASSAVEEDEVDEGSWDPEKKVSKACKKGLDVVVCVSEREASEEVDALVVFCRAFCLLMGRGK